jgi:hypothetical protein
MKLDFLHEKVGETNSGKSIYRALQVENLAFLIDFYKNEKYGLDDLFEAYALYEFLGQRALKRGLISEAIYIQHSLKILECLGTGNFEQAKLRAKIVTVIDVVKLGRLRASVGLKDV